MMVDKENVMNLFGTYQNGNYSVTIYDDGTKIRETNEDSFISSFPECIDLKITNKCDMGCPYCHENSTIDGLHADLLDNKFIDTLKPFTELAIGGGNPLSHPNLKEFLIILKSKNIIANITVNQTHFLRQQEEVKYLVENDLIKGLGVSLTKVSDDFITNIKKYSNAVIHVINGVVTLEELRKLYNNDLKLLILGYKEIRRGIEYYSSTVENRKQQMYDNICEVIKGFKVVSFDNLSIKQLDLRRIFTNKDWNEFYMGDDGQFTMYIDLVNREFSKSSTTLARFALKDNIGDMFKVVKSL
jgi:organic radical activating enzyme